MSTTRRPVLRNSLALAADAVSAQMKPTTQGGGPWTTTKVALDRDFVEKAAPSNAALCGKHFVVE
jgi:hypothetical protein